MDSRHGHRVLTHFKGTGCRPCWIITCPADDAKTYLGPYADEFLTFADPDRHGEEPRCVEAPALLLVRQDGEVIAKAEGWNADEWRAVTESIAEFTHWSRPPMPADGDPAPTPTRSPPDSPAALPGQRHDC